MNQIPRLGIQDRNKEDNFCSEEANILVGEMKDMLVANRS